MAGLNVLGREGAGVATFRSHRFRRISGTCCSTIVLPLEWEVLSGLQP